MSPDDPILAGVEQYAVRAQVADTYAGIFEGRPGDDAEAARFVATFHRTERVETHPGLFKCRVHYQYRDDDPEYLDTDPLSRGWAAWVAQKAEACHEGDRVLIVKRNAPDPTGKTPAGFRRIIWLHNLGGF